MTISNGLFIQKNVSFKDSFQTPEKKGLKRNNTAPDLTDTYLKCVGSNGLKKARLELEQCDEEITRLLAQPESYTPVSMNRSPFPGQTKTQKAADRLIHSRNTNSSQTSLNSEMNNMSFGPTPPHTPSPIPSKTNINRALGTLDLQSLQTTCESLFGK